jgi:hypothetical protein
MAKNTEFKVVMSRTHVRALVDLLLDGAYEDAKRSAEFAIFFGNDQARYTYRLEDILEVLGQIEPYAKEHRLMYRWQGATIKALKAIEVVRGLP